MNLIRKPINSRGSITGSGDAETNNWERKRSERNEQRKRNFCIWTRVRKDEGSSRLTIGSSGQNRTDVEGLPHYPSLNGTKWEGEKVKKTGKEKR
jgi:hypothetical protein